MCYYLWHMSHYYWRLSVDGEGYNNYNNSSPQSEAAAHLFQEANCSLRNDVCHYLEEVIKRNFNYDDIIEAQKPRFGYEVG